MDCSKTKHNQRHFLPPMWLNNGVYTDKRFVVNTIVKPHCQATLLSHNVNITSKCMKYHILELHAEKDMKT